MLSENRIGMGSRWLARLGWIAVLASAGSATFSQAAAPCDDAVARGVVCETANDRALALIQAGNWEAITVVQDVKTGGLVAFAASVPEKLDVTTAVLPLSTVKLLVAAMWWDHEEASRIKLENSEQLLADSLVSGNDNTGRRLASALRDAIGTEAFLKELERYGFPARTNRGASNKDETFWAEQAPRWKERLIPALAYHSLGEETSSTNWGDTLSLGEERFVVTALHLSRFLQAVGNGGVMLPASARGEERPGSTIPAKTTRVMSETAALKLQAAMRAAVERGTAKSAAPILAGTGWSMGGKTGTGPAPGTHAAGPDSDRWFGGLSFDSQGKARFTIVTFVKHGGLGGGIAARLSAELTLFLSGARSSSVSR
jgi:cell division protein FtsI/penicillin-binding protein 2